MASADPILLGGGVAKGAPFTVGTIQLAQSATPASIADSIIAQRLVAAKSVITIGADQWPADPSTLKLSGGFISDSAVAHENFIAGNDAVYGGTSPTGRNILIGAHARMDAALGGLAANMNDNIVIGSNNIPASQGLRYGTGLCILIGSGILLTGGTAIAPGTVLIGPGITCGNFGSGVAIGEGAALAGWGVVVGQDASSSGNYGLALGNNANTGGVDGATAIGQAARSLFAHSIALGRNANTDKANQLMIGGENVPINEVHIGGPSWPSSGGKPGGIAVLYRHTDGLGTNNPAANIRFRAAIGTGNAVTLGRIQFETGIPGASGATPQTPQPVFECLPCDGVAGSPPIAIMGYASGGGAGAGTLGNAPAAGNPTEWIPVLTPRGVKHIPAW